MVFGNRVKVLIVDDEPSICQVLMIALGKAGYDPEFSVTADGAMDIVRERHVDVMVMDLRLKDGRGDTLFELAAATQPQLRTQTLFMTGDITEAGEELIDACHCEFMRKPFDLWVMLDKIAALSPRIQDRTA